MRRTPKYGDLIALVVLTFAGASAGMAQGTATPARLTGGDWVVQSIGGASVAGDGRGRIAIAADGRVTGSGGCNRLMGRTDINGESITFSTLATTRMACAPAVMQQERKLLDALQATRSYRLDGAALTLRNVSGRELMLLARRR